MIPERTIEAIADYVGPLVADFGLELVEVQFRRESHGWVLRISIDNEDGITVDHCAKVSREVSAFLDVEDLIDTAYNLEVSSPGLDRPLNKIEDYVRFTGREVKITLQEPVDSHKKLRGIIDQVDGNQISIKHDSRQISLQFENIAKGRLIF